LPNRPDQLNNFTDAQPRKRILPPIGTWLQCNLNAPTKEINARDWRNASQAIAARLWTYDMECMAGAQCGDQTRGAKF
jgi:hypothetical protein